MSENTQHKEHWLGHKHVPGLLVNAKAKPQSESQKGGGGSRDKYYLEALCVPGPGRRSGGTRQPPVLGCGRSEELRFRGKICAEAQRPKRAQDVLRV